MTLINLFKESILKGQKPCFAIAQQKPFDLVDIKKLLIKVDRRKFWNANFVNFFFFKTRIYFFKLEKKINIQMIINMMDNGKMANLMAMGQLHCQMVQNTKDNRKTAKGMAMVPLHCQMVRNTNDNGKTTK